MTTLDLSPELPQVSDMVEKPENGNMNTLDEKRTVIMLGRLGGIRLDELRRILSERGLAVVPVEPTEETRLACRNTLPLP
jgi:hypothetical protein